MTGKETAETSIKIRSKQSKHTHSTYDIVMADTIVVADFLMSAPTLETTTLIIACKENKEVVHFANIP
jgi:hypothetical protein